MAQLVESIGRGDIIDVSCTTTTAINVGDILVWASGYVDKVVGQVETTLAGSAGLAGVAVTKKGVLATAALKTIAVQTRGLVMVHVTEEQGGTTRGNALKLSASTANLATIIATVSTTVAFREVNPVYLGQVIVPAVTTGASDSTMTTAAVVNLGGL